MAWVVLVTAACGGGTAPVVVKPEVVEPPRPYCDEQTLERLLSACGDGFDEESARNRAIILALYESGMRVGELCKLEDTYVNLRERWAQALGKGKQWRPVFWQPPGACALIRYVLLRRGPRETARVRGARRVEPGCRWRGRRRSWWRGRWWWCRRWRR